MEPKQEVTSDKVLLQKQIRKRITDGHFLESDFDTLVEIHRFCFDMTLSLDVGVDLCMLEWHSTEHARCAIMIKVRPRSHLGLKARRDFQQERASAYIYRELCNLKLAASLPKEVAKIVLSFCCNKRYKHILAMF